MVIVHQSHQSSLFITIVCIEIQFHPLLLFLSGTKQKTQTMVVDVDNLRHTLNSCIDAEL